jgi:hypothetical protein
VTASPMTVARAYVILSLKNSRGFENLSWYKTGCAGYTANLLDAGRFTRSEAETWCVGLDDVIPLPISLAKTFAVPLLAVPADNTRPLLAVVTWKKKNGVSGLFENHAKPGAGDAGPADVLVPDVRDDQNGQRPGVGLAGTPEADPGPPD